MSKIVAAILAVLLCAGCSSVPVNPNLPNGLYKKLIVRDINWKETATSDIPAEKMSDFISWQPGLNELFRSEFISDLRKTGTFDDIAYGDKKPDADTLTLVPKIYTLRPVGFMPGATFTGFLVAPDGKLLATYSEERRMVGNRDSVKDMKENIESLIRELAEDAAAHLPYRR